MTDALGLLRFAFVATTAASLTALLSLALRLGAGPLAFPALGLALAIQALKLGLPVEARRLRAQGRRGAASGVMTLWLAPFAVCAFTAITFATEPHPVRDRAVDELIARKEAAVKSMERKADAPETMYAVYQSDVKRIAELKREISELKAAPPKMVSIPFLGVIAVAVELLSSFGLPFLLPTDKRTQVEPAATKEPEPEPTAVKDLEPAPAPAGEPVTAPAFVSANAKADPSKATAWLWPGVLPLGAMTLLTGQPKVGKSQIAIQMAAITSVGGTWPTGQACASGGVILCEVEDSFADTQARLIAAGADLSRIAIRDREAGPLDLSGAEGMATLTGQASSMGGVRLAVLSPLLAFFGKAGATDDAAMRARLSRLLVWAAQNRVAVLGLLHPAKNAGKGLEAQFAGADAYRRAARSAFVAMPDASDPEPIIKRKRRVLICAGVNGWSDDQRYFYRIEGVQAGGAATSRVVWLPGVQAAEDDGAEGIAESTEGVVPADKYTRQRAAQAWPIRIAEEWLLDRLTGAEPLPSTAVIAEAAGDGIAERTLRRAAKNIGVTEAPGRVGEAALWSLE